MRRRESGFSLLEMMIALAIVAFVLAAASTFFVGVVKQYKVQSKIIESNVEGVIGLELMRQDIGSLGFGLPWNMGTFNYEEPVPLNATDPPRAVESENAVNGGNSDYLIIRSALVGMTSAAGKWTTLRTGPQVRTWIPDEENLAVTDKLIVLSLGGADNPSRQLLAAGATIGGGFPSGSVPTDSSQTNIVYGIDNSDYARPFNRADYYIANKGTIPPYPPPFHCATNTGVLVKAVVSQGDNVTKTLFPLLDCVADLQVVYGLDTNADGEVDTWTDNLKVMGASYTASDIRAQLVELHVHVLAQVGQRDNSYRYPNNNIDLGRPGEGGENFKFNTISDYEHYRWKVYNIVVKPKNLAN